MAEPERRLKSWAEIDGVVMNDKTVSLENFIIKHGMTAFMRVAGQKCYGRMDHLEREQSIIFNYVMFGHRYQVWIYGTNPNHRELAEMAAAHYRLKGGT